MEGFALPCAAPHLWDDSLAARKGSELLGLRDLAAERSGQQRSRALLVERQLAQRGGEHLRGGAGSKENGRRARAGLAGCEQPGNQQTAETEEDEEQGERPRPASAQSGHALCKPPDDEQTAARGGRRGAARGRRAPAAGGCAWQPRGPPF